MVFAISIYVAETPKASIKEHELPLLVISFGTDAYGFVGQPFSKQLYVKRFLAKFKKRASFARFCFSAINLRENSVRGCLLLAFAIAQYFFW